MQATIVSIMGVARRMMHDRRVLLAGLLVAVVAVSVVALWPSAPAAQQTAATTTWAHETVREQDERLERLLQEPYLAELAQIASVTCDAECFSVLWRQMWDLAEQMCSQ